MFVLFLLNLKQSCLKKELISAQQDFVIKNKTKTPQPSALGQQSSWCHFSHFNKTTPGMPVICTTYLPTNSDQCTTKIVRIITKKQRVKLVPFLLPVTGKVKTCRLLLTVSMNDSNMNANYTICFLFHFCLIIWMGHFYLQCLSTQHSLVFIWQTVWAGLYCLSPILWLLQWNYPAFTPTEMSESSKSLPVTIHTGIPSIVAV